MAKLVQQPHALALTGGFAAGREHRIEVGDVERSLLTNQPDCVAELHGHARSCVSQLRVVSRPPERVIKQQCDDRRPFESRDPAAGPGQAERIPTESGRGISHMRTRLSPGQGGPQQQRTACRGTQ